MDEDGDAEMAVEAGTSAPPEPASAGNGVSPAGPRISARALRRLRPPRVPLEQRKFTGCSSIDMYDVGQKLGQGTFGLVRSPPGASLLLTHSMHSVVERACHKITGADVALKRVTIHDDKDGVSIAVMAPIALS